MEALRRSFVIRSFPGRGLRVKATGLAAGQDVHFRSVKLGRDIVAVPTLVVSSASLVCLTF